MVDFVPSLVSYKHDLRLAAERERSVERAKAQLELDWQRRVEEREREVCGQQESMIRTLTTARDEVSHTSHSLLLLLLLLCLISRQQCDVLSWRRSSQLRTSGVLCCRGREHLL